MRNDVWNISDEEIKSIKNREILLKEFDHINKIIEEKEKSTNNLTLLIISGLGFLGWNVIYGLGNLFSFLYENNNDDMVSYIKNNLPPMIDIGLSILSFLVVIFVIMTMSDLFNRNKFINRKNLILNQLKKKEKINRYKSKNIL